MFFLRFFYILFFLVFFSSFVGFIAPALPAPAISPEQKVRHIFPLVREPAIAKDKALQERVMKEIHFTSIVKSVLGSHYGKLSKEDLAWFRTTLKSIISLTVYPQAPKFFEGVKIQYQNKKILGNEHVKVHSLVKKGRDAVEVVYSFRLFEQEWKVVDLIIDGESWVESITDQVDSTIKKSKWEGLRNKMNNRLLALKNGLSKKE